MQRPGRTQQSSLQQELVLKAQRLTRMQAWQPETWLPARVPYRDYDHRQLRQRCVHHLHGHRHHGDLRDRGAPDG